MISIFLYSQIYWNFRRFAAVLYIGYRGIKTKCWTSYLKLNLCVLHSYWCSNDVHLPPIGAQLGVLHCVLPSHWCSTYVCSPPIGYRITCASLKLTRGYYESCGNINSPTNFWTQTTHITVKNIENIANLYGKECTEHKTHGEELSTARGTAFLYHMTVFSTSVSLCPGVVLVAITRHNFNCMPIHQSREGN